MTYLITGATRGLGRETARHLARAGVSRMILPVRDAKRGDALRAEMEAAGCRDVSTPLLELASLADIHRFVEQLGGREKSAVLTGLLLNAGVQSAGQMKFTVDGIEQTFAVNHLAAYALFKRLSPLLSPKAIVGWTSSETHNPNEPLAGAFGFRGAQYHTATILAEGKYPGAKNPAQACRDAYATSKMCVLLMARHFAAVERGQKRFFSFDPGLMPGTGLAREQHGIALAAWNHVLPLMVPLMPFASTPEKSGRVLADLALGKLNAYENGSYINQKGRVAAPFVTADEPATIKDLLETSDALMDRFADAGGIRRRAA